ncbi:MAG: demethoxyubiquinone hydroxylase family protein [Proteobacteria bacterium]|nr:demethoxyubiquinone hydroxylase family protein [Pseudomonadota bacterium]
MSGPAPLPRPGQGTVRQRLGEILRVDHAGELGAVAIYRGQRAVFEAVSGREKTAETLAEMEAHEQVHLERFDALLNERKVRPTLMAPFWRVAGFALGAGTALLGEKAAHACTEAVETVIEAHYAGQIAELAEREPELAAELTKFRDDELAHRDQAVAEGAREAPGYALLSAVIRAGCKAAIRISEKA